MKILLVVEASNDVFIYNYAKWLKKSLDCVIDVFEFIDNNTQGFSKEYYDHVFSANCNRWFKDIIGVRSVLGAHYKSHDLSLFLSDKKYDIIHCHWLMPATVLTNNYREHTNNFFATFWGGEERLKILFSHKIYSYYLDKFLKNVDCLIGSKTSCNSKIITHPYLKDKCRYGNLGSAPLEFLYNIIDTKSEDSPKEYWEIPTYKKTVLIGYSGKALHQHIKIVNEINTHFKKRESIHLLVPMTRGASADYINKVECVLKQSGLSYTLLRDRFLSDKEIAWLRSATDITLQFSLFDDFSRSVVECFCAKSVVLYGDWLENYDEHLSAYDFRGVKVHSIKSGIQKLDEIIEHWNDYTQMTEENSQKGRNSSLWSECIKPWVEAYKGM